MKSQASIADTLASAGRRLGVPLFLVVAASCLRAEEPRIRVASLHTVLTEIASEVGGGQVEVEALVRPGDDPHTYQPSPEAVARMTQADIVLAAGLNLEPYLDRLVRNAGVNGRVIAVGDSVPVILSVPGGPGLLARKGERDPHWWHSITDMLSATDIVRREFSVLRPGHSADFAARARAYEDRLSALQAWTRAQVARLRPAARQLVTSHDAFAYFARDYGFTVHSISGLSPDGEPDARELAQLIDFMRSERVGAIFPESTANPRLVRGLMEETGAALGGALYADGLGPAGSGADTYEGMFRHNVSAIVSGLAPAPGPGAQSSHP
jgi:zinc/manganese transport system substrate-binding protein